MLKITRLSRTLILLLALMSCSSSKMAYKGPGRLKLVQDAPLENQKASGQKYMVASQGPNATRASELMFSQGGNVVDAAIAASFVISVERPQSTGLGGGGFMLIKTSGDRIPVAYDFREMAPLKAYKNMYLDHFGEVIKNRSLDGIHAVAVPGLVAGLMEIHQKYGSLPLSKIMAPAIELAASGFAVNEELAHALEIRQDVLSQFPASKAIFFKEGKVLKEGDWLVQQDLAQTLRVIAKYGRKGFYEGEIAKAIVSESKRLGGVLSLEDFKAYKAKKRVPIRGSYKGYKVYSMPPPSSGGVHIVEILNILENDNLYPLGPHHPKSMHLTAEAMKAAFYDRARYMGDDDFVEVPVEGLTSKKYAKRLRSLIPEDHIGKDLSQEKLDAFAYESSETTHFSIMDAKGNAVVSTQTINGYFGSGVVAPGTGILLNNEMDDFAAKVGASNLFGALGGEKNLIAPKKRPLSSMSPTLVFKDGIPILAVGTPSGTRILTCVAQTLLNFLEYKMPLYESVAALRYHHQYSPNKIFLEPGPWDSHSERILKEYGHQLEEKDLVCRIQAVAFYNGQLEGVSDPRGAGLAHGL